MPKLSSLAQMAGEMTAQEKADAIGRAVEGLSTELNRRLAEQLASVAAIAYQQPDGGHIGPEHIVRSALCRN